MQKQIHRLKEDKLHESILEKQNKSFIINIILLIVWTSLVVFFCVFAYIKKEKNVDSAAVFAASITADRYILSQEVNAIFKDIYFETASSYTGARTLQEENINALLGSESDITEHVSSTRLSPIINEFFGNKGVYLSFVDSKISKNKTRPDLWTHEAMQALENGEPYVFERVELHNAPYMRAIFPAKVRQRHKELRDQESVHRFFKTQPVGTIYTGVSVYYPLYHILDTENSNFYMRIASLLTLWIFGIVSVFVFGGRYLELISRYAMLKARVTSIGQENRKELENCKSELKELFQDKEDAIKNKAQFFAKVSHEIRTPLNGVLGMSELLLRTKLTDDQSFQVASLRASANNLLDVFNDIWDYSRIEVGTLQVDSQPFALRDTLYSVVKIFSHQASSKGVELIANIAPNIPDNLLGDPTRIRQVLSNLLSNAIKFTDKGEILLSVSETSFVDDVAKINFTVKDTGIGIPEDKKLAILSFEQMHDESSKRKYEGLGLGLAISSRLISLMGGKLKVETKLGVGSSFSFSLNLPYLPGTATDKTDTIKVLKDEHVLIVDDNATNRRILREQVREWGMVPSDCTGVDEALRLLKVSTNSYTPFSVVISDLQMPEKDGIDLVQEMKKDADLSSIPVILLSSAILGTDMAKELFFASLYKPARPSELVKALAAAVNHKAHTDKDHAAQAMNEDSLIKSEKSFKILLVEDLEINKLVVTSILKELGHTASVAKDGQEALDILEKEEFDLVLMDIHMPVMDGIQAIKIIRQREEENGNVRHLPVIALTANADNDARKMFIQAGLDSYILKPSAIQELHYEIERVADRFNLQSRPMDLVENGSSLQGYQPPVQYSPSITNDEKPKTTNPTFTAQPSIASKLVADEEKLDISSKIDKVSLDKIESVVRNSKDYAPSIFAEQKTIPLVPSDKTSEPSIARNILPNQINLNPSFDINTVKAKIASSKVLENTDKFVANTRIDEAKYAPSLSFETMNKKEKESIAEQPNLAQDTSTEENLSIKNESIEKGNDSMIENTVQATTHFSSGKERKVIAPIDSELLAKSFASYPDLAYRSIEIFLRDAPKSLIEIKNAIEADDNSTLTVSAHAVKGLISYYSKGQPYELALKLEHMGRDKVLPAQKDEVLSTLEEFEVVFDLLLQAMKVYME